MHFKKGRFQTGEIQENTGEDRRKKDKKESEGERVKMKRPTVIAAGKGERFAKQRKFRGVYVDVASPKGGRTNQDTGGGVGSTRNQTKKEGPGVLSRRVGK